MRSHFDWGGREVDLVWQVEQGPGTDGTHRKDKLLSLGDAHQLVLIVLQEQRAMSTQQFSEDLKSGPWDICIISTTPHNQHGVIWHDS